MSVFLHVILHLVLLSVNARKNTTTMFLQGDTNFLHNINLFWLLVWNKCIVVVLVWLGTLKHCSMKHIAKLITGMN